MSGRNGRDPLRVLVQINSLALGGTQLNAVDMARALRERGVESMLVGPRDTLPDGPSLFDVAAAHDVRLEAFDRPTTTLGGARTLARIAARERADLVHVWGSWHARPAYWGPCLLGRRPLVMTIYEMAVPADTYSRPDLVVGTGYLIEDLIERKGPVHLVSPPVDLRRDDRRAVDPSAFVSTYGLRTDSVRVVLVSRLDESMKALAVEQTIEAVSRLEEDVELVVVGGGDAETRLRAQARVVNTTRKRRVVTLTGPMTDPRVAYAAADVSVGMGGSAARALAFGNPLVVSGEFGWYRTFTPDSAQSLFRNSFWSDESDQDPVDRLEQALRALVADPGMRESLGRFGRSFAHERFGLDGMASRLEAIYRAALRSYSARQWLPDLGTEARVVAARRLARRAAVDTAVPVGVR